MKRSETLRLSEAFRLLLNEEPDVHEHLLEMNALECLPQLLGEVYQYITQVHIKDGVLHLKVYSTPVAKGIILEKHSLVRRINESIGAELLRDILVK